MTERKMYNYTVIGLTSTILVPIAVAVFGITGSTAPISTVAANYVKNTVAKGSTSDKNTSTDNTQKSTNKKKATTSTKDAAKTNDKSTSSETAASQGRVAAKPAGMYTVKAGDTYGCIAEKYYGSYEMWPQVYQQNGGWPGYTEYNLDVGAKLQMPALRKSTTFSPTHLCG